MYVSCRWVLEVRDHDTMKRRIGFLTTSKTQYFDTIAPIDQYDGRLTFEWGKTNAQVERIIRFATNEALNVQD